MMAHRLLNLVNKYEENFHTAYITWYDQNLDLFLEPIYDITWALQACPEVDWSKVKSCEDDVVHMIDGSTLRLSALGRWVTETKISKQRNFAI